MSRQGPWPDQESPRPAEVRALRVAQEAVATVPAYGRFLRMTGYDISRLRGFDDFCALPIMDKGCYLTRYPLAERCRRGELSEAHIVTLSSGTSGPATFWPRTAEQGVLLVDSFRTVFEQHFRIRARWSLIVVAAALGPWGFGTAATQATQRIFTEPGIRGTVVTPGLSHEEALRFVEQLGPHYDQIVLMSYPTLAPPLLEAGQQRGIDWRALNTGVFTSGESTTELQRERILQLLGRDPELLEGFVNVFGATEVGSILGYETRLCLLLRRLCTRDPALTEALFDTRVLPSLNQYNPLTHFLQVENGEIVLTVRGAVPLIRYSTHDRGGVIGCDVLLARCLGQGYDLRRELAARGWGSEAWQPLPFLFVHGRSDGVTLHSVCVYLEEVAHALEQPVLLASNTGNFEMSALSSPEGRATLRVAVELRDGVGADDALCGLYQERVLAGLTEISPRFRATYQNSQDRTRLEVVFLPYGTLSRQGPKHQRAVLPGEARGDRDGATGEATSP